MTRKWRTKLFFVAAALVLWLTLLSPAGANEPAGLSIGGAQSGSSGSNTSGGS